MDIDSALNRLDELLQEGEALVALIEKKQASDLAPALPLRLWQEKSTSPVGPNFILDPNAGKLQWCLDDGRVWKEEEIDFSLAGTLESPLTRFKKGKNIMYKLWDPPSSEGAWAPSKAVSPDPLKWSRFTSTGDAGRLEETVKIKVESMKASIKTLKDETVTLKRRRDEVADFEAKLAAKKPRAVPIPRDMQ